MFQISNFPPLTCKLTIFLTFFFFSISLLQGQIKEKKTRTVAVFNQLNQFLEEQKTFLLSQLEELEKETATRRAYGQTRRGTGLPWGSHPADGGEVPAASKWAPTGERVAEIGEVPYKTKERNFHVLSWPSEEWRDSVCNAEKDLCYVQDHSRKIRKYL